MIINWISVMTPEMHGEGSYTDYIVGATTEERMRHTGFLDVNETSLGMAMLRVYPAEERKASELTGHPYSSHPAHPEHQCGIDSLRDLMACVVGIEGLSEEEAYKKLWGKTIQPIVTDALKLPAKDQWVDPTLGSE